MPRRYDSQDSRRRILAACVRLFMEKGYNRTTVAEIIHDADVSASTFQNIFRAKDGVLVDLCRLVLDTQLRAARELMPPDFPPAFEYAAYIAVQLTTTELNANLRDIYVEAYTQREAVDFIQQGATTELMRIFHSYLPDYTESDFYELEVGTSGMTRSYMARPCDKYFTLERKLRRYLSMTFGIYGVPKDEQDMLLDYIASVDIRDFTARVIRDFFISLAGKFDFELNAEVTTN